MAEDKFGIDQIIAFLGLLGSEFIRFDIDYFFSIIKSIEKDIGEIIFLRNLQVLPERHSENVKNYFMDKVIHHSLEFLIYSKKIKSDPPIVIDKRRLVSSNNIHYPPKSNEMEIIKKDEKNNTINIDLSGFFSYSLNNHLAIEKYIISYEFLLANFVHPIFNNLKSKKRIPKKVRMEWKEYSKGKKSKFYPNHLKILAVQEYIKNNEEFSPLVTLIEDLDTELRNALVHENYYIKDQVIHYFRIINLQTKQFDEKTIDIMRLHIKVVFQLFRVYLFSILISMKFIDSSKIKEILNFK